MELFINSISSITNQNSFDKIGFSKNLTSINDSPTLVLPEIKALIPASKLRRMSSLLKISSACGIKALNTANIEQPDAIIVGTGLGCLTDTEKFLKEINRTDGTVSPTSFIQSTHNTISGQISLLLKNHAYNMTHTQNSMSFENALLDCQLHLTDKGGNVLLGAADERIDYLETVINKLSDLKHQLGSGCTFMTLSNKKTKTSIAKISKFSSHFGEDINENLVDRLTDINSLDNIYYLSENKLIKDINKSNKYINISDFSGEYATNSAFAVHCAIDNIQTSSEKKTNLVINNLLPNKTSLILIESI